MSEIQYTTKDSNPHEQIGWLTTGIRIALMDLRAGRVERAVEDLERTVRDF